MRSLHLLVYTTILLLSGCAEVQHKERSLTMDGLDSANTVDEIKQSVLFGKDWKIYNVDDLQILIGMAKLPTSGESYIDVHGYVYNKHFREWRRFCLVRTRNVGLGEIVVDKSQGMLYLMAKANNDLKGKRVFQIDIGVLSDDRAYVNENIEQQDALDK